MRAINFSKAGAFALEELPDPIPGEFDAVMRVTAVGLCGTDIHVLDGEFEPTVFPIVPGHEAAGVIAAVGSGVTNLVVGDKVALDPTLVCGTCRNCHEGRGNLCDNWNGMGVARGNGATAELVLAPAANFHKLRDDTNLFHAALIEPLACAVHGFDLLPRTLGSHYLIYGAGTMGLMMAQIARFIGALSVSIVDINESRLAVATEIGFENTSQSANDFDRTEWTVVIDCTGAIPAIEDGLRRVARGGTFLHFGVAASHAQASYSPFEVYNNEISIIGSMAIARSFYRAVELFEAGVLNAEAMISHTFTLEEYGEALDLFRAGTGRKLQIIPHN